MASFNGNVNGDINGQNPNNDPMANYEDGEEYLDPNDVQEIIEIDDDTNMEDIVDRLEDIRANHEQQLEEEEDNEGMEQEVEEEEGTPITPQKVFRGHKASVFSCSLSPCGTIAATGGEDDVAYVWTTQGQLLFKCKGHKDSVSHVSFSSDGELLLTADMSGLLQVWSVANKTKVFSFGGSDAIIVDDNDEEDSDQLKWIKWIPRSHTVVCGALGSGEVWVIDVDNQTTDMCTGYGAVTTTGHCTRDGKRVIVGYEDGKVRVLKVSGGGGTIAKGEHTSEVTCVAEHADHVLAMSGSMDGTAMVFNTNTGKVIDNIDLKAHSAPGSDKVESVECVAFCNRGAQNLAIVAGAQGTLLVYDLSARFFRHSLRQPAGSSVIVPGYSPQTALVAGLDGVCRAWNLGTGVLTARYTGHEGDLFDLSVDGSGKHLLTASDDGTARVYNVAE